MGKMDARWNAVSNFGFPGFSAAYKTLTRILGIETSAAFEICDRAENERQWWGSRSLASISVRSVSAKMRSLFAFVFVSIALLAVSYASPYNKYGRTCKDILCTVREECVMQRDECTGRSDKCGTYPTCKRKPGVGKTGCAAMRCPTGHFCSIRQENCDKPPCQIKPTCIAFRTPSPSRASNVPVYSRPVQSQNRYSYNSPVNRNSWVFDPVWG